MSNIREYTDQAPVFSAIGERNVPMACVISAIGRGPQGYGGQLSVSESEVSGDDQQYKMTFTWTSSNPDPSKSWTFETPVMPKVSGTGSNIRSSHVDAIYTTENGQSAVHSGPIVKVPSSTAEIAYVIPGYNSNFTADIVYGLGNTSHIKATTKSDVESVLGVSINLDSSDGTYDSINIESQQYDNLLKSVIDIIYPIGSVIMTMTDSDPKNRPGFSHTNWAKIESGHYLKSIETGSPNTGGSTTASIPLKAHTHTGPSHSHGLNSHTHGMTHYHKPYSDNYNFLEMSDSNAISLLQYKVTSGGDNAYVPGYARSSSIESAYIRSTTTSGAIYDGEVRTATSAPLSPNTSTETGGTGNTGSAGESANPSINLDPKYQEVFVWKRVVPGE